MYANFDPHFYIKYNGNMIFECEYLQQNIRWPSWWEWCIISNSPTVFDKNSKVTMISFLAVFCADLGLKNIWLYILIRGLNQYCCLPIKGEDLF